MTKTAIESAEVGLERDGFVRTLIGQLAESLQDVVGLEEAEGFVSVVGRTMGRQIDRAYRAALGVERLDRTQVAAVLTDLKRRIHGDFRLEEESDDQVLVYTNRRCPFEEKVEGRPALCMMTSNVFGSIAADNLGYARVQLEETIAQGHGRCRVLVHLEPPEQSTAPGREYVRPDGE